MKDIKIIKKSYENIKIYYLYNNNFNSDKNKIIELLKISICLNKFAINNDDINRNIIWIPIRLNRDFNDMIINKKSLEKSKNSFTAFTASGTTFSLTNKNERTSIITRYEEVEKLLIHELIHNYCMDGSKYDDDLNKIINEYRNIKNIKKTENINYDYEYSIYESYTELLATYLTLIFINIEINEIKKLRIKFVSQIIIEIFYSYNIISNLIYLNNYKNWDDFKSNLNFYGDICFYEYYFIKGLLYNNYIFEIGTNIDSYKKIYLSIIKIIKNFNTKEDKLLKKIYKHFFNNKNYKYMINI